VTQLQVLREWADIAVGVTFWVCLLWPALVRPFWPWHQHEWGWNMVIKTELLALALLSAVLKIEFGVTSGLALLWIEVLAVSAIPPVVVWRAWIIWRSQRAGALRAREQAREVGPEPGGGTAGTGPRIIPAPEGPGIGE